MWQTLFTEVLHTDGPWASGGNTSIWLESRYAAHPDCPTLQTTCACKNRPKLPHSV
ncbi:hypothetical protein MIZ03_0253 [Rhodoferax lithotrophicus]|uniref:Uncharacterized protein n=1 Tax=Rhodoferax lithotrophicus TaxID=2798804 RepID=A0ABM7MGU8_9BURK|nr:hypothetical protein MIZ03_0253 [Rhodoferax sp. MIZ03]